MCLNIWAHFLLAAGFVWRAALKKTKVKLDLLTDVDMLLIVGKGITGRICLYLSMCKH